ncbi:MAG: ABC transporter permease [Methanoculleaceae archaeon]
MTYLIAVAVAGAMVTAFLWLRDCRIYIRSGLPGYRTGSRRGVLYTALSLTGLLITGTGLEAAGLGLILLALYLQGKVEREDIWRDEGPVSRFLGAVERSADKE